MTFRLWILLFSICFSSVGQADPELYGEEEEKKGASASDSFDVDTLLAHTSVMRELKGIGSKKIRRPTSSAKNRRIHNNLLLTHSAPRMKGHLPYL